MNKTVGEESVLWHLENSITS